MPSTSPTSSFERPCAINSTTCRCRDVMPEGSRSACMPTRLGLTAGRLHCPKGVSVDLRDDGGQRADEGGPMTPLVRRLRLILVEGANACQELELVAQVRPHHLGAVRRDRERHSVV